jgi:hypothetical protein
VCDRGKSREITEAPRGKGKVPDHTYTGRSKKKGIRKGVGGEKKRKVHVRNYRKVLRSRNILPRIRLLKMFGENLI